MIKLIDIPQEPAEQTTPLFPGELYPVMVKAHNGEGRLGFSGVDYANQESWTVIAAFKLQARTGAVYTLEDAMMTTDAAEVWGWF